MTKIYTEENGIYCIDCTRAVWSSDRMHEDYQKSGIHISDVDFLIEDDKYLYLVDYKKKDPLTGEGTVYQIFREEQRK